MKPRYELRPLRQRENRHPYILGAMIVGCAESNRKVYARKREHCHPEPSEAESRGNTFAVSSWAPLLARRTLCFAFDFQSRSSAIVRCPILRVLCEGWETSEGPCVLFSTFNPAVSTLFPSPSAATCRSTASTSPPSRNDRPGPWAAPPSPPRGSACRQRTGFLP